MLPRFDAALRAARINEAESVVTGYAMRNGHAEEIAKLIEPGRVHRRVYADPDVFELEMERIFGRAWLFVGHAQPGAEPGRLHHHRARPPARDHVPSPRRQRPGAAQPLHPSRRQGGQRAQGSRAAAGVLLSRLDATTPTASWLNVPVPEGCGEGFDKEADLASRARRASANTAASCSQASRQRRRASRTISAR